jgi:hypothetical protein
MKPGGAHALPCHVTTVPSSLLNLLNLQDEEIVAPGGDETMSVTTVRVHAAALAGTLHAMGCTSTASTNARQW